MSADRPSTLIEIARLFFRLGSTAFGGPAAHVAMMEDEVVRRRGWLTREEFLDYLGATNLIPGPNSTELAIHVGYARAGWPGLLVAGLAFIVPAAAIVGIAAWAYVRYGALPEAAGVLYGIKPVVIAIVAQALWGLGRTALKSVPLALLGAAATIAVAAGVHELLVLATAAAGAALLNARARPGRLETPGAGVGLLGAAGAASAAVVMPTAAQAMTGATAVAEATIVTGAAMAPGAMTSAGALSTAAAMPRAAASMAGAAAATAAAAASGAAPFGLWPLFLLFAKIGAVLFGSGYVLLAFLRADFVERLGWLTEQQLLDATAIGQVTPGPLFTTATFIGYVLGGPAGAFVATAGIFLPAFVFVALSGPLVPRLRRSRMAGAALDGVNAASLALMAVVSWQLARAAIVDPLTALLAAASLLALVRYRLNSAWLVALGALVGWLTTAA